MSNRLRNFKQRGRITQLINGLLIGLEIKDRMGRRLCLSDNLRLCYIGVDQDGGEHLLGIWTEGFIDLVHFENLLNDIEPDEWSRFTANIALNHIHEEKHENS